MPGSAALILTLINSMSDSESARWLSENNNRMMLAGVLLCTKSNDFYSLAEIASEVIYIDNKEMVSHLLQPNRAFEIGLEMLQSAVTPIQFLVKTTSGETKMNLKEALRITIQTILELTNKVDSHFSKEKLVSPLIIAAKFNWPWLIKKRLVIGDSVDSIYLGNTPLLLAVEGEYREVISLLLEAKADPNIPSLKGIFPLNYAVMNKNKTRSEIIRLLLDRGADPLICIKIPTALSIDILELLPHLKPEQHTAFFEIIRVRLPDLIQSVEDLALTLKYFPTRHRTILEIIHKRSTCIIDVKDLILLLNLLDPTLRMMFFEAQKDMFLNLFSYQNFADIFHYFKPTEFSMILNIIQANLPEIFKTVETFIYAITKFKPEQHKMIFEISQSWLLQLIKEERNFRMQLQDLKSLLVILEPAQCISICESKDISEVLKKISDRHEVRSLMSSLSPEQRMAVFKSNGFLKKVLEITQTLEDIRPFLLLFTPEQCRTVCDEEKGIGINIKNILSIKMNDSEKMDDIENMNNLFKLLKGVASAERSTAIYQNIKGFDKPKTDLLSALLKSERWDKNQQEYQHICHLLGNSFEQSVIIDIAKTLKSEVCHTLSDRLIFTDAPNNQSSSCSFFQSQSFQPIVLFTPFVLILAIQGDNTDIVTRYFGIYPTAKIPEEIIQFARENNNPAAHLLLEWIETPSLERVSMSHLLR